MLYLASQELRRNCAARLNVAVVVVVVVVGMLSMVRRACLWRQHPAMFDVRKAERRVRWKGRIRRGGAARRHWMRVQREGRCLLEEEGRGL
jgi:hypothetical protein